MEFKKFNSIENSYREKWIDRVRMEIAVGRVKDEFVVSEKVHGANFSLWYDGETLKSGKKSGYVGGDGENFYNSHIVKDRYAEKIKALFEYLKAKEITIFGELYGGSYPHPDVEKQNIKSVQKGILYSPTVDFYAFDLVIDGEYVSVSDANTFFEKFGIFYARSLCIGTLTECLEYSNEYKSLLPAWLGLPELDLPNICEGNVIRPVEPAFFFDGKRVIIKNKNKIHSEKSDKPKIKETIKLTDSAKDLLAEGLSYVTANRLRNVLSKWEGEITDKDFGRLMGMMNQDAMEDFVKDFDEPFNKLEKNERKYISKQIGGSNSELLRDNFLNVIDNNF